MGKFILKLLIFVSITLTILHLYFLNLDNELVLQQTEETKDLKFNVGNYDWNRSDDYTASSIINLYLRSRIKLSLEEITDKIFKVELPNISKKYPHSYPFLSGDTLRAFADIVFDRAETDKVLWKNVQWKKSKNAKFYNGSIIFVKADYIEEFSREVHPSLKNSYILITHNSDYSVPRGPDSTNMLDDAKLIRWFAQNPGIRHPKLEPVPIGFENRWWKKIRKNGIF